MNFLWQPDEILAKKALNSPAVQSKCELCRRTVRKGGLIKAFSKLTVWTEAIRTRPWSSLISCASSTILPPRLRACSTIQSRLSTSNATSLTPLILRMIKTVDLMQRYLPSPWRFMWRHISSLSGSSGDSKIKMILFCLMACATVLQTAFDKYAKWQYQPPTSSFQTPISKWLEAKVDAVPMGRLFCVANPETDVVEGNESAIRRDLPIVGAILYFVRILKGGKEHLKFILIYHFVVLADR